mmetsp:Transcript_51175/g.123548  ORF Transcript_51175/g.123548 Transcript_51175/m.123548 type:complete len:537 (+) Transcript_51175:229-1839(+)
MKFFKATLASLVALAGFSEASLTKEQFDSRLKSGQFDMKALMKGAKPHSDAAKKIDGQRVLGDNFQITSSYSIQFLSCFSLTTSYDEIFENGGGNNGNGMLLSMWQNGQAIAERSYAIFRICYTDQCEYTENDPSLEYVIDLNTFVQAFVTYLPDQVEDYCGACEENNDYCQNYLFGGYGYAGAYGYGGEQYQNNNGGRHLGELEERKLQNGFTYRTLDCEVCMKYGCIQDDNNNNGNNQENNSFEASAEWLATVAQCSETGAYYSGYGYGNGNGNGQNNNQLFASFICNAEGTGVELGMFMDENCILYLPEEPYYNYMSYFDQTYVEMTKDIIEFTFTSEFSCANNQVIYTTQDVSSGYYYGDAQGQQNNDQNGEAAEWCTTLWNNEQGTYPSQMYDCDGNAYNYYYGADDDDNDLKYQYNFYDYDISEDYALTMSSVCLSVKKADGELKTFYNNDNGQMYNYGSSNNNAADEFLDESGNSKSKKSGMSGGAKFFIVMLVGLVVGGVVALVMKMKKEHDEKKAPLVGEESEGELA